MSDHKHDHDHHHHHHHHDHDHEHCDHHHDHDHDHDHDHKVILLDENGQEKEFDIVTWFEVDEKNYVVLMAAEGDLDEGIILRLQEEDGQDVLVDIEDEEEWNRVLAVYEQLYDEQEQQD